MEDDRFITSTRNMEDEDVENTLRPTNMDDYVGQEKVKNKDGRERQDSIAEILDA